MTKEETIEILRKHNEWRRYDGEVGKGPEMIDPKTLGEAIDTAIQELEMAKETIELAEDHALFAGRVQMEEEMMKGAIHCKVFWHDGPLLDYTQEQQDAALERIGAEVGDKVKIIILKDDE